MASLDDWYETFELARPWAESVLTPSGRYPVVAGDLAAAAAIVLGVQGLIRDLENRALTAERRVEELETEQMETRLLANPELVERIRDNVAHPERSVPRPSR